MYEIDFLAVGDAGRHGDAIGMRFTRPDTGQLAHVIVDAGFQDDGDDLVALFIDRYGTDHVDLVVLTHADSDHYGGLSTVLTELEVDVFAVNRPALHGYAGSSTGKTVEELVAIAESRGATIHEPFAGSTAFGGALLVAGPDPDYYVEMLAAQEEMDLSVGKAAAAPSRGGALAEAIRQAGQRFLAALPVEVPFGDAGGTKPRNNGAVVIDFTVEGKRFLFTSDVGVPALNRALDHLDTQDRSGQVIDLIDLPHHGSRHNLDTPTLDRMFGPPGQGQDHVAVVSVAPEAVKHPAPRVANGFMHRGYKVFSTAGKPLCYPSPDAPQRADYGPATPLSPMAVPAEED